MGEDEVRSFAGGDGTGDVADAYGVCAVECQGIECLDRRQAHLDAGEGHHEAHISHRRGAGIVVGSECNPEAGFNEFFGPCEGYPKEER